MVVRHCNGIALGLNLAKLFRGSESVEIVLEELDAVKASFRYGMELSKERVTGDICTNRMRKDRICVWPSICRHAERLHRVVWVTRDGASHKVAWNSPLTVLSVRES